MPSITITVTDIVAQEFTELAKNRGYNSAKDFLVAWARAEVIMWRSSKAANKAHSDAEVDLKGQIT